MAAARETSRQAALRLASAEDLPAILAIERASFASPALYFPLCLQLLRDGHVDGRAVISHTFPLERIAEAMQLLRDDRENTLKIVVTP